MHILRALATILLNLSPSAVSTNEAKTSEQFILRPAVEADVPAVYQLVRELREFHDCDPNKLSEENIRKYGFGAKPLFKVELAEVDQKIVGMAIYYIGWAGFSGYPEIKVEDFYVKPKYQHLGIGRALAKKVVQFGIDNDCQRISGEVATRKKEALEFYESIGGEKMDHLSILRMPRKAMEKFVNNE